jgi:hypothetical protein
MWVREFHGLFPEAAERYTGRRQDLSAVEREVAHVRAGGPLNVEILQAIEESPAWDYPRWWPRLSASLREPVQVPSNLSSPGARRELVNQLHERLQHIEIVSVVLRFVFPQGFGIISPPVTHLIALPPEPDHTAYFLKYISVLKALGEHYEGGWGVADIDMALWSAAHLQTEYVALATEMYQDGFFQQTRLANLLAGVGKYYRQAEDQRILLARAMLGMDFKVAAAITGKVYDALRKDVNADEFARMGIARGKLNDWRKQRNRAMHENPALSKREATEFVHDIADLLHRLESA